jgi:hypothetical protein
MMNQAVLLVRTYLSVATEEQKKKIDEEIDFLCSGESSNIKSQLRSLIVCLLPVLHF